VSGESSNTALVVDFSFLHYRPHVFECADVFEDNVVGSVAAACQVHHPRRPAGGDTQKTTPYLAPFGAVA